MTFISNLNKLEQQHLKSVLVKEIENNKLHGCRVMGFDFSKQQDNKIGFPKGWMKEDFSLVKDLKELNKYNIITRPTNLLVIEFDKKKEAKYEHIRCEALENVKLICDFLDKNDFYYIICDHNKHNTSLSPHIYLLFEDLPVGNNQSFNRFNNNMKEIFIEYLKHKVKLYDRFTQIDKNFINQNGNMPLIFQIHWKLKHNNAVQELNREGKGKKLITLDMIVNKCIKRKDL